MKTGLKIETTLFLSKLASLRKSCLCLLSSGLAHVSKGSLLPKTVALQISDQHQESKNIYTVKDNGVGWARSLFSFSYLKKEIDRV